MKSPLVANLVANLEPTDMVALASQVALLLKPSMKKRRKSLSVKGLFKHSRSHLWYWRLSYQGKRYLIPLGTTDDQKAHAEALRQMTAFYGTTERKTTAEEKNAYIANLQAKQTANAGGKLPDGTSAFAPTRFIEWYENFNKAPGRHRSSTVKSTSNQIDQLCRELGVTDVRRITAPMLNQWRDKRLRMASKDTPKAKALKAATSISTIYRNVRAAFAQAASPASEGGVGLLTLNPLATWKPFTKAENKRLKAERQRHIPALRLPSGEIKTLLEAANAYSAAPNDKSPLHIAATLCVWLLTTAGLRWTEAQYARWENIDWGKQLLHLLPTEHFTTKSGKSRIVPLPSITIEKLIPYRQDTGFILPSIDTKHTGLKNNFDRVSVRPHVEAIIKAAKLSIHMHPHGLRHVYVTMCLESGIARDTVQAAVGHASGLVTAIYDHSQLDAKPFKALLSVKRPRQKRKAPSAY